MPQAGFDPPFAEGAEFTELKTDAFTNQATTAGRFHRLFLKFIISKAQADFSKQT